MMIRSVIKLVLLGGMLLVVSEMARAQALPISMQPTTAQAMTMDEVTTGSLLVPETAKPGSYRTLPLQSTNADMQVNGPIARTTLTQTFNNPGQDWLEAIYAFPLPENAAVDHMDLLIGDRVIQGQIQEKQQARQTYQAAKAQGQRTALVEQHRPNLFTTAVANIPPGGEVQVRLQYQQQLSWRDNQFALRFPMAITPRYKPGSATSLAGAITPEQLPPTERIEIRQQVSGGWSILPGEIPNVVPLSGNDADEEDQALIPEIGDTQIRIELNAGFPLANLESRYHMVKETALDNGALMIELAAGGTRPDRDFELVWTPQAGQSPTAAFFTESGETGDYGLLMVMPPDNGKPLPEVAREVLFIIDTSGSMGGASIRQARQALSLAIDRLADRDSFNVIEFNSHTRQLFDQPVIADEGNRSRAIDYVEDLEAGGGTEMLGALKAALQGRPAEGRLAQVIFITDGAVGNEAQLLEYIQQQLGQRRLFTVGIGSAPNSYFMKEAAHFGKGTYSFISSPNEVREKMLQLFTRIEKPVLTNLVLSTNSQVKAIPGQLPDLYAGEPLTVALRLDPDSESASGSDKGQPLTRATLEGRLGNALWQQELQLGNGQQQQGIAVNYGREAIRQWMRAAIHGASPEKVREEVLKLAFEHHLVSQYTSLVAVDVTPVRPVEESLNAKAIDGVMPAGFSHKSNQHSTRQPTQQVRLASGATSSQAFLLLGLLLILIALASWKLSGRKAPGVMA